MLDFIKTALAAKKVELLRVISPANHVEAKQAWLEQAAKGHFTNPTFVYNTDLSEAKVSLGEWSIIANDWEEEIQPKTDAERLLYLLASDYIEHQRLTRLIATSVAIGDDSMTNSLMRKHYGVAHPDLVELAYKIADGAATVNYEYLDLLPQKLSDKQAEASQKNMYSAKDIKRMFDAVLDDYRLQDTWKVIIDDEHSAIRVSPLTNEGDSRIFIPRTREVDEIKCIQLAGHEIENHVRHNENCINLLTKNFDIPRDIAAKLVSERDSKITEGFAKMSDAVISKRCLGTTEGTPVPWYVIMADLAAKGESFAQVTEHVHEKWGVDLEECWLKAIRIFRGCHDTSNPHGFSRQADCCYLEGYIQAIRLSEEESPLFDFAKFDENLMVQITQLIGKPIPRYPHLGIANKIVNGI